MGLKDFSRVLPAVLFLAVGTTNAAELDNLSDVTRHTVATNPQVRAAFYAFEAATEERKVARGGYYPRLDVEAGIGRERIDDPRFSSENFTRDAVTVSLNQMLFDGFATRNEVLRMGQIMRARYFEVHAAAEESALETSRAYLDLLRHRALVRLSEDNYATHRSVYEQIEKRVSSGLSRRSDLDQAAGRLALAESNLVTDLSNLHDVTMRYQRIVGLLPPDELQEPKLPGNRLPSAISDAIDKALNSSPSMRASITNVLVAEADSEIARAPMMPRFDIRARQEIWHDKDNINGRYEEGVVELVGTYNLFNGNSDVARRRQRLEEVNLARELRTETCRNIRQQLTIAYNDTAQLKSQLVYLDRHQLAIARAREAYRSQFNVGQRTLLDLLDADNEYYEASRSYVDADRDHSIAIARTLAAMGTLITTLNIEDELVSNDRLADVEVAELDADSLCPRDTTLPFTVDKEAIYKRALERRGELPQ